MYFAARLVIFFFIYSFAGWVAEVAYAFYVHRRFVNRGFLSGPICPLYGFGIVLITLLLEPLDENRLLLFVGATLITSALEYLAGWLLAAIFKTRWWDYSDYRFNLNGYICLRFSLVFGVLATLFYYFVHPHVALLVDKIPGYIALWFAGAATVIFLVDLVGTVISALHLKQRMREMQAIILNLAAELKEDIKGAEFLRERRDDLVKLKREVVERYERLSARTTAWQRRLLSSFPEAKSTRFQAALDEIRDGLRKNRKK